MLLNSKTYAEEAYRKSGRYLYIMKQCLIKSISGILFFSYRDETLNKRDVSMKKNFK